MLSYFGKLAIRMEPRLLALGLEQIQVVGNQGFGTLHGALLGAQGHRPDSFDHQYPKIDESMPEPGRRSQQFAPPLSLSKSFEKGLLIPLRPQNLAQPRSPPELSEESPCINELFGMRKRRRRLRAGLMSASREPLPLDGLCVLSNRTPGS